MMIYDNRLNPINTTLSNPPGARSAPYKYTVYEPLTSEIWEKQEPSVACDIARTAGDKQAAWCARKTRKPNCPMSRNLEPTQRVDADISYCARDGDVFGNNYKIINKGPYSTEVVSPCAGVGAGANKQVVMMKTKSKMSERDLVLRILMIIGILVVLSTVASKF